MAIKVWNQSLDPLAKMAGTVTCVLPLLNSPNRWMAVSAAHVLAPLVADGTRGPSSGDQVSFLAGSKALTGTLWFWCDLQREVDGFSNELDAALVEVSAADAKSLLQALNQPAQRAEPQLGAIAFDGVTSGPSNGSFDGQRATAGIPYGVLGGTFAGVSFKDSLRASLRARPGDSGALVTSGGLGVGMLVASEGEQSRFLSLAPMVKSFGLDWPSAGPIALPAPPPAGSVPPPPINVGDAALAADTLARTLWGEARSEPLAGIRAVAAVVLNRATHPRIRWWGRTVTGVCRAPFQFSCWNANDSNRPKLLGVTQADKHFRVCQDVAQEALAGQLVAEQSLGATHYHTKAIRPSWLKQQKPCADIGAHLFYNDIDK